MSRIIASFSFFLLVTCATVYGQTVDFNRVVLPVDQKAKDFREYLVQCAWMNNPDNDVYAIEIENAKDQIAVTKKDWMKDVQVTSNINEANVATFFKTNGPQELTTTTIETINGGPAEKRITKTKVEGQTQNVFFPRYNLGVNVNLGTVLTQKPKNRIRERELKMVEHQLNQRKLRMRGETLERYELFLAAHEIYKTRTQIEQDAKASYLLVGSLYKTDEKTFEDYNEASSAYYGAMEARIKAESERRITMYRLEEIIGLTWDQVKHSQKEPNL